MKHLISMQVIQEFAEVAADMEAELGAGNKKPEILAKLAQYETDSVRLDRVTTEATANMLRLQENAGLHSRPSLALFHAM